MSVYPIGESIFRRQKRRIVEVLERKNENPEVTSLYFKDREASKAEPGQFLMIWIPGVDEIPLSVSYAGHGKVGVTVKKVGEATIKLCSLTEGSKIGVRGPLGRGFTVERCKALIVGGGVGVAPLRYLIYKLIDVGAILSVVFGFSDKMHAIFLDEMEKVSLRGMIKFWLATERGDYGFKGTAYDLTVKLLKKENFDRIYACGPEKLERKLVELCLTRGIDMEASLEGYVKCGMGLCGSCVRGCYLICREGPVLNLKSLAKLDELGLWRRRSSGLKEFIS